MICGEGRCDEENVSEGLFMIDLAKEHKALAVALEHRVL